MSKLDKIILSILLPIVLSTACSQDLSETERVARAEGFLREGKISAATIELKGTLQKFPGNAQARLLLGQVSIETGDLVAAQKELSEALSLGAPPDQVVPPLSRVLRGLGKHEELEMLSSDGLSGTAKAELLASKGLAELDKGNPGPAAIFIEEAAALDAESPFTLLAQARLAMRLDTNAKAREFITKALVKDPDSAQAFDLLGDIEWRESNLENAVAAYDQAIANQPGNGAFFILKRALINVQLGRYEAVEKDIPQLNKIAGNSPGASYVLGVVEHNKGNYEDALAALEIARRDKDNFPQSFLFTASTHYALGNLQQADLYASQFVNLSPGNVAGRKLLAIIRQNQANYIEVIDLLTPVVEAHAEDTVAIDLLATAHLRNGETDQVIGLYERLVELQPESALARLSLGNALLAGGEVDRAIETIEKATQLDPELAQAQELLVFAYLRAGNNAQAIRTAENFLDANPDLVSSHILFGRVLLAAGQTEEATKSFEKACQLDQGHPFACGKLAELAMSRKDFDLAQNYYQKVLEHNENNLGALVGYASLNVLQDDAKSMQVHLQQAIESHPKAIAPRLVLARYYLLQEQAEKVAPLLEPLDQPSKRTPNVLRVLASAQIMQKQFKSAISTLQELIKQEPNRANSYVSLARVYAELKDPKKTQAALQTALDLDPQHFTARMALARLLLVEGDEAGVEANLVVLRTNAPEHPDVLQLESSLTEKQGDMERSLAFSEQALKISDTYPRMMAVADLKQAMGDAEGAFKLLESWTQQHPDSVEAQITLTMAYTKMDRIEEAIQGHQRVLQLDGNNVLALNDLAWHLRTRDKEQALLYAKRAEALKPDSPEILDTLALVYLEIGKLTEARTAIDSALIKAPNEPSLLYHQAMIMAAADDNIGALKVLDRLAVSKADFQEKEAALALRKDLSSKI